MALYAIVEDLERMFIIPESWICLDEGDKFVEIFYPNGIKNSTLRVKKNKEPKENWDRFEVAVLKRGIKSYEDAENSLKLRQQHANIDSKYFGNRRKSQDNKRSVDDEYDFDHLEQPKKKIKLDNQKVKFENAVSTTIAPKKLPFNASAALFRDDDVTDVTQSKSSQAKGISAPVSREEFEQLQAKFERIQKNVGTCVRNIHILFETMTGLSDKIDSIENGLGENQLDSENEPSSGNEKKNEVVYDLEPICTAAELKEMEEKLAMYNMAPNADLDFKRKRQFMVQHYSSVLRNTKPLAKAKTGLMAGLLTLYVSNELIDKIGWTQIEGCLVAMRYYTGHMAFFRDIINSNSPGTYSNLEEAATSLRNIIRRARQARKMAEKSAQQQAL